MGWLSVYFAWPDGQVWPNLVASAISTAAAGGLVAWKALQKLRQQHEKEQEARATHKAEIAQMLTDHHAAIVAAVAPSKEGRS